VGKRLAAFETNLKQLKQLIYTLAPGPSKQLIADRPHEIWRKLTSCLLIYYQSTTDQLILALSLLDGY
jgi:hypothetical protein